MPVVPRISGQQVQASGLPNARLNVQTSTEAFGGGQSLEGVEQAAQGVIKTVQKFALEEKARADDTWSKDFYAKAARAKQEALYNPETGALNRRGKDSFGISDEYGTAYDKQLDELESTASSDSQRQMAKQIRNQQKLDLMGDLERHTMGESKRYEEETSSSAIKVAHDEAVLNYQNPQKVAQNMAMQQNLIMDHAQKNGKDSAWVQAEVSKATSQTHGAIIERMITNGQDIQAEQYYQANKGSLTHGVEKVEGILAVGTLKGESQRQSDIIIAQTGDMGQALKATKAIENPKIRDATADRVKTYFAEKKAADNERSERIMLGAGNIIDQTGDYNKIPESDLATLSPAEKSVLRKYAENKRDGIDAQPNSIHYQDLKYMAAHPSTRNEFVQENLEMYRDKLTKTEMKELIGDKASILAKDGKADAEHTGYRTKHQIVIGALDEMKIKDKDARAEFQRMVDERAMLHFEETKKKAGPKDIKDIVDTLTAEARVPGMIYGTNPVKVYKLKPGQEFDVEMKDIPKTLRSQIENSLKSKKKPVNEQNIKKLYILYTKGLASAD